LPEHVRSKIIINSPIPAQPPRRRGGPPKNGAPDHPITPPLIAVTLQLGNFTSAQVWKIETALTHAAVIDAGVTERSSYIL
jgi:hypothetical protein